MPRNSTKTERASVECDDGAIEYTLVRSARRKKTIEIRVEQDRGVVVLASMRALRVQLDAMVRQRADWIALTLAEQAEAAQKAQRRFADGATLLYLGNEMTLRSEIVDGEYITVRAEDGAFRIGLPTLVGADKRDAVVGSALTEWYKKRAATLLPQAVERWQDKVSRRKPMRTLIRNQRKRWGSCSSDGSLRLNWRVVMAPPPIIDYLVVHELAHLDEMNHSARFWKLVARHIPDHKARRNRLREIGRQYWF